MAEINKLVVPISDGQGGYTPTEITFEGSGGGSGLPDEVITYEQFMAKTDEQKAEYTGYISGWPGSGGGGSSETIIYKSSNFYGTCSNQAANQNKAVVVSADQNFSLSVGALIAVKFDANNTYSATSQNPVKLNVNSTGNIQIYAANTATPTGTAATYLGRANYINYYIYDGTYWIWAGSSADNDSIYTPQGLGFGYATCSTAASTAAKEATLSGYSLITNGIVSVKFTNDVPANSTLNINSKGAKDIWYQGTSITDDVIEAGDLVTFIYDGTRYQFISIDKAQSGNGLPDEVITYSQFRAKSDTDQAAYTGYVSDWPDSDGSGSIWTNNVICSAGDTSCVITNTNIKTTSAVDVYSQSVSGKTANITSVVITNGRAVVSFDTLTETTNIRLNIIDTDVTSQGSNWTAANACASGDTTKTITDSNILTTSMIKAYCENSSGTPVKISSMVITTGQAVLTFDTLTEATNIKLLITNV